MQHIRDRLKLGAVLAAALLLFTLILSLFSCKKDSQECEKWLVQDFCYPKNSTVHCFQYDPKERSVCGDELSLARQGKVKIRKEDQDVRLTTVYIRKVG